MKTVLLIFFAVAGMSLWAGDSISYFRDEDAPAYSNGVASIRDIQCGELYAMTWSGDYHLDRVLDANCTNMMQTIGTVCSKVLNDAPVPPVVTGMGCSAFAATNAVGDQLVGRNFDYRFPMAHVLLFAPRAPECDRPYASVGTVDAGFAGFDVGSLTNLTDMAKSDYPWHAALFPYLCMDGMNDAGFMVTVLSIDGRPDADGQKTRAIEQFVPGHTNIVPTTAIRYLLDHAGSTAEGVSMLTNFNMFAASGPGAVVQANYHFLLSDVKGDSRIVEWLPPAEDGGTWTPFVTNATAVSNFWLADGYGHGSNRWEIMRHALARQNGHLEESDAMTLCRAVSQKKGAEQTSWTHWSVVYNLANLAATIATLGNYDEIVPYRLDRITNGWTVGSARSARHEVLTELPQFDEKTAGQGKVYLLVAEDMPSSNTATPPAPDGASLSAVNRMGCTYDTTNHAIHVVVKANGKYKVLCYADMADRSASDWTNGVVAGVNEKGLSARIARFRDSGFPGSVTPSQALVTALLGCDTATNAAAAVEAMPLSGDTGVIFTDAMGNVAVWPKGSECRVDDASEMLRNSLDLRKGIYEIDGSGRGQFDELPGLMRLASSDATRAIVSTGYGHLDVSLPDETNVLWRVEFENAGTTAYGVIADPTPLAHATAAVTIGNDDLARNNQGWLVAETNAELTVTYRAEDGYLFQDDTNCWRQEFGVAETLTTPPVPGDGPHLLVLGIDIQSFDLTNLDSDGAVKLIVEVVTGISGTLPLPGDAVAVQYADGLVDSAWKPLRADVVSTSHANIILKVYPPGRETGFLQVVSN